MALDCLTLIKDMTGLNDREVGQVLRELQQEVHRRNTPLDPEIAVTVAKEAKERILRAAKAAKRAAQLDALKLVDAAADAPNYKNRYRAATSMLVGSNDPVKGARNSVEAQMHAVRGSILEGWFRDLEAGHDGLLKTLADDDFNVKIAREMWNDTAGTTTVKSITGDLDAFHAASVFDKYKEIVRALANKEGADIDRLPGHVFAQVHDPRKIANAGFQVWRDAISGRLDILKTFGGQDVDKVLRSIYSKIEIDRYNVFTGAPNESLAGKLSKNRFLIFKSAEDWLAYNKEFGTGGNDVAAAFLQGLSRRAEEVGLMQRMGSNPDAFLDRYIRTLAKSDPADVKNRLTEAQVNKLKNQYAALSKLDRSPVNPNVAYYASAIRKWMNTAKLGGAMISSFMDLATSAANAKYNGLGYLSAYADLMKGPDWNPRTAGFLGTFTDGMLGDMAARLSAEDGTIGALNKASNTFFKLNGLRWWTDRMKAGYAWAMAQHLSEQTRFAWDSIPNEMRRNLSRYGLDAADWKVLQGIGGEAVNGKKFLTPDQIADAKLSQKVRAWFMNEAEFAVPTPGAAERAFALHGTRPGTLPGEVLRFMWQFKMFMLSTMMKTWPRTVEMGIPGAIHLAAMSTILGYASMSAKDMLSGRAPQDPTRPATIASALVTSGGMGVMGDLLFSNFNATGRSLQDVAMGPVAGSVGDVARIWAAAWRGDDAAGRAVQTAISNTPFANVFYLRAAINYGFMYHVQEMLNPGYLQRMERRIQSETRQTFYAKPSDYIRYGGGFR